MASTPVFNVRREEAVLVAPAEPTPHEFKTLSDIDDQEGLRFHSPNLLIFRNHPALLEVNLAPLLKEAIAKALVFYYPFAGRLREGPGRKLVVECTGEGVLFIEAKADVGLELLGDAPHPPFPCVHELLYNVPGSADIVDCPLLLVQLTNFTCGGFILGLRFNHCICDNAGMVQFLFAIGEMALGADAPSRPPIWQRHLLCAREPPRITCTHQEYAHALHPNASFLPPHQLLHRSFFFGPAEIASLRNLLPPHHRASTTTFELLTACLWRCRTVAIAAAPDEEVKFICDVNARGRYSPPLPSGYYGNVLAFPAAVSPAGKLCQSPLENAVELVKKMKAEVTQEYVQSVADLMATKGRPPFDVARTWMVSDLRRGAAGRDLGWGAPIYSGPVDSVVRKNMGYVSFYVPHRNEKRVDRTLVLICLEGPEMERFSHQVQSLISDNNSKENE